MINETRLMVPLHILKVKYETTRRGNQWQVVYVCVCVGGLFINLSLLQNHSGVSSQLHVGTAPSSNQCWLSPGASVSFQVALCAQQISCVTVLNSSGIKFAKQTVCTTCIRPHVACSRHKYWNHQFSCSSVMWRPLFWAWLNKIDLKMKNTVHRCWIKIRNLKYF